MSAPHWGFVPINKLENATDYKRLNAELEAIWNKLLGNMLAKDFRDGEIEKIIDDIIGTLPSAEEVSF